MIRKACLIAVLLASPVLAQSPTPPPAPAPQDPQAAILGDHKKPGNVPVLILKTTGTIGQDPKITCTPASNNWQAMKSLDGELVIMFFETAPGVYVVALATNLNNKTALAAHDITVGNPAPIPPPNPNPNPNPVPLNQELYRRLQQTFNNDQGVTQNATQMRIQLVGVYRGMADVGNGTWRQLQTTLAETTKRSVNDALPSVRTEATKFLITKFPGTGGDKPVDAALVKSTFTELADALAAVTP